MRYPSLLLNVRLLLTSKFDSSGQIFEQTEVVGVEDIDELLDAILYHITYLTHV